MKNCWKSWHDFEKDRDGCYLISTAADLDEFKSVAATSFSGCAKLVADIRYIGNTKLLNDDLTLLIMQA